MIVAFLPSSGFDPTEAAVPWRALDAAGIDVRFATPDGRMAAADERLVSGGFSVLNPILMTKPDSLDAYRQMIASEAFRQPMAYSDVVLGDGDGLLLPGGHEKGVKTLLESAWAQALAADAMVRGLPIGAICHGVVLLARSINPANGLSVLNGRRTTSLTNSLELSGWRLTRLRLGDYYRTYPQTVQDEVVSVLADATDYDAGPKLTRRDSADNTERGFIVRDGNYVSARWPGDAHTFARELIAVIQGH